MFISWLKFSEKTTLEIVSASNVCLLYAFGITVEVVILLNLTTVYSRLQVMEYKCEKLK